MRVETDKFLSSNSRITHISAGAKNVCLQTNKGTLFFNGQFRNGKKHFLKEYSMFRDMDIVDFYCGRTQVCVMAKEKKKADAKNSVKLALINKALSRPKKTYGEEVKEERKKVLKTPRKKIEIEIDAEEQIQVS